MPVPTDITAGTISISGNTVTGVGTSFVASDIRQGDLFIWIEGGAGQWSPIVQTVTSNTVLTLAEPWTGPTISGARYRLRYQWDSSRVSAQSRQLIEMLDNGNVLALAGLTGPGVPVFDGPHSMEIRTVESFINGVAYDVQVDTLADRAAYDGQTTGFAVLVSDVGDGRSAIYSKASNTSGDWTDPAYVTGPQGAASTVPGIIWRGTYSAGTEYVVNDGVRFNNSSFRKLTNSGAGNPPSSANPPVDNADWAVLAAKGADGSGTGDVVGPTSSTSDRLAAFNGTTGKLIKDSGYSIQSTPTDNRIDRVLSAGAFGVGRYLDLRNTLYETGTPSDVFAMGEMWGFARAGSPGLGIPGVSGFASLEINAQWIDATAIDAFSRIARIGSRQFIQRATSASAWGPWREFAERGSNANGEYVRLLDGTQNCYSPTINVGPVNVAFGSLFSTTAVSWTFPVAFIAAPWGSALDNTNADVIAGFASQNGNTASLIEIYPVSLAGARNIRAFASGRWY